MTAIVIERAVQGFSELQYAPKNDRLVTISRGAIDSPTETLPSFVRYPGKTSCDKAKAAVTILNRYRLEYTNDDYLTEGIKYAQAQIERLVDGQQDIRLVLPAFPFKSPNRISKVLGSLPDEAERISLLHLDGLCKALEEFVEAGVRLTIVSDGIMYNDLLGVPDDEVWKYGEALRTMAEDNGCHNIHFARICDLLGQGAPKTIDRDGYLQRAHGWRKQVLEALPVDFDINKDIESDEDTLLTYRAFMRFLSKDLESHDKSRSQCNRDNSTIARSMLIRRKAFDQAIRRKYGDSVRLSIHASNDIEKISIAILPQQDAIPKTPWHGALSRGLTGGVEMMHANTVPVLTHELIFEHGRPSYFRARSELFDWAGLELDFKYLYPCGLMLAEVRSPVILRGFKHTRDRRTFIAKAHDLGTFLPWKTGVIQELKYEGSSDPKSSNAVSSEAMPMHYDGIFKMKEEVDIVTGIVRKVSDIPRFQYFVCQVAAKPGSGATLFASSDLLLRYLPKEWTIARLSNVRWSCTSQGYFPYHLDDLPLIMSHPATGQPCIRWHQPWPQQRTAFGAVEVRIQNGSESLAKVLDELLYDRRVCLRFEWQEGDVLVSDNFTMMHTREAFDFNEKRELWRIHTD